MAERGKGFPRLGLSSAVKVIETASKFGKSWSKEQFAGFGSQSGAGSAKSGAFANRVAALKDYGLITATKENISLTDLGVQIVKPVTENERDKAIAQAFLNVEVFKKLFESLETGEELSLDQVAQSAVFALGISRDSKDKFLNVFIDSGRFVHLVTHNKERSTITLAQAADLSHAQNESTSDENTANNPTTAQPTQINSISPSVNIVHPVTEQGVNYAGEGWTLTVLLKTSMRLAPQTRKKVRDLIETADLLSDDLHDSEKEVK